MPVTEGEDDVTEQRPGRERDNSLLLTQMMVALYQRRQHSGIAVFPCQDVRVSANCTQTADICVTLGEPAEQVFTSPPFLCVEILSAFVPVAATLRKNRRLSGNGSALRVVHESARTYSNHVHLDCILFPRRRHPAHPKS